MEAENEATQTAGAAAPGSPPREPAAQRQRASPSGRAVDIDNVEKELADDKKWHSSHSIPWVAVGETLTIVDDAAVRSCSLIRARTPPRPRARSAREHQLATIALAIYDI